MKKSIPFPRLFFLTFLILATVSLFILPVSAAEANDPDILSVDGVLTAASDLIVVFFDLLIYTRLISLKHDNRSTRVLLYGCCTVILSAYFFAAYIMNMPAALSSFICMSLPSLVLFWIFSKYKDARFFTTFCFVDTVSLIIAFISRVMGIYGGTLGALSGCLLMLIFFIGIYIAGHPHFPKYRELLDSVSEGWIPLVITTLLAYFMLIFTSAYPKPLKYRLEYIPIYAGVSLLILSFYVVFIFFLFQKRHLHELNIQLKKEKKWHDMAYVDALTKMSNRMAYIERINLLPREMTNDMVIYAVMIDIDRFKNINDNFGHHAGDIMLTNAADLMRSVFGDERFELFRIGGDEFAVIAKDISENELADKLAALNHKREHFHCTFSYGSAQIDFTENNAIENAFVRADTAMYQHKSTKKGTPS